MTTILVVDDDVAITTMLEEVLSDEGYTVSTAYTGMEALAWLAEHRATLVLCDQMMPGISGAELCQQINQTPAWAAMRIIMMTAGRTVPQFGTCRYDVFLAKPFTLDQLLASIEQALIVPRQMI